MRPILIATVVINMLAAASWFGLFAVAMGLGFKSDWSAWDHSLLSIMQALVYVFCLPSWFLAGMSGIYGSKVTIVLSQLAYAFIQAAIMQHLWVSMMARNKKLQSDH